MIRNKTALLLSLVFLQVNCASASITGKVLKYTSLVAAPLILKHTLLSKDPAQGCKELWSRCKDDGQLVRKNIPLYKKLVQKKLTQLKNYFETIQDKAPTNPKEVFEKTKNIWTTQQESTDLEQSDSSEKK